ncbi:G8 domain-containing protein [Hyaloraphidium curvatum]|nr:G8 domain-containing protein [Hyaloraphidium curvatum]
MLALLAIAALVAAVPAAALQRTAGSGRWSAPATWSPAGVPAWGDSVAVPAGASVVFDAATPRLRVVEIAGELAFEDGAAAAPELALVAETVLVRGSGLLRVGSADALFQRRARITLINFERPAARIDEYPYRMSHFLTPGSYGTKMLAAFEQGRIEIHGQGRNPTWTHLAATASRGQTFILVDGRVDWRVGDEIVVATTDFGPNMTDRAAVLSTSYDAAAGTTRIDLAAPLPHSHFGRKQDFFGWTADTRAEVGVLTSNVVIEGDMGPESPPYANEPYYEGYNDFLQYGGHSVFTGNSVVHIEGIEARFLGQGSRLARYPIHWHIRGDARGQYFKRSSVHDSFNRAVTIHATQNLLIQSVVAYWSVGHAFYLEDGSEEGNQFWDNLVVTALSVPGGYESGAYKFPGCSDHHPGLRLQMLDDTPSAFWITNVNNTFVGNAAVGAWYGFWIRVELVFNEPNYGNGQIGCTTCRDSCRFENDASSGTKEVLKSDGEGLIFLNNVAHSNVHSGWWVKENWTPPTGAFNLISGFLAYKNQIGLDNYGITTQTFDTILALDNYAFGINTEWLRYSLYRNYTLSNILLVGESENHGYPNEPDAVVDAPFTPSTQRTTVSGIFPGVERTNAFGLNSALMRLSDGKTILVNATLVNSQRDGNQIHEPQFDLPSYPQPNFLGWFRYPDKRVDLIRAENPFQNVRFHDVFWARAPGNVRNAADSVLPSDAAAFLAGWKDVDGSFPCSPPGSYWLFNSGPEAVPNNCEYRPELNFYVCPPFAGRYNSFFAYERSLAGFGGKKYMTWECGKRVLIDEQAENTFSFNVRSDSVYTLSFENLASFGGLSFETNDWATTAQDFVLELPGLWEFDDSATPESWVPSAASYRRACSCGTTYLAFTVDRMVPAAAYPQNAVDVWVRRNPALPCSAACPAVNPFAGNARPPGYCSTKPAVVSGKTFAGCGVAEPAANAGAGKWPAQLPDWLQLPAPVGWRMACKRNTNSCCQADDRGASADNTWPHNVAACNDQAYRKDDDAQEKDHHAAKGHDEAADDDQAEADDKKGQVDTVGEAG